MTIRHSYQRGDVILIRFPFSDASGAKERPAVVLSSATYHDDWDEILVMALTSRPPKTVRPTDYQLQDWSSAGLQSPSWVRCHLATVHRNLVIRKVGSLSVRDLQGVERSLRIALALP